MTREELKKLQDKLTREHKRLSRSPKARREFLVEVGITTPKGNFKKAFKSLA